MDFINVQVRDTQEAKIVGETMVHETGIKVYQIFPNPENNKRDGIYIVSLSYGLIDMQFLTPELIEVTYPIFSAEEYLNWVEDNKNNPDYIQKMKEFREFDHNSYN